ncbi:MAG TPA: tRNA glutamyl-Q(34) synthetase GluQRS [Rhizomicrobium sp.]|nr:tRNA glutamyl-Q(34) synthetase GluQRS [Rhizomicrobium sp.]
MIVTRFAPSPTGYLHLGHAFSALIASDAARAGRFLLRIEDIDRGRSREEFVEAIFEDLGWLGLRWEEPVLRQSARFPAYRKALDLLEEQGVLYPCFCTRADIAAEIARSAEAPHGPDGALYPGTCRTLSAAERRARIESGTPYALRLDSRKAAARLPQLTFVEATLETETTGNQVTVDPLLFGDVVLARKDVPASYHLAVVVDDAEQGVTLVTRGRDLLRAAHIQRVLQELLRLPAPRYAHHRLILDENGRKLSKRDGATSLRMLRLNGTTAEKLRRHILAP